MKKPAIALTIHHSQRVGIPSDAPSSSFLLENLLALARGINGLRPRYAIHWVLSLFLSLLLVQTSTAQESQDSLSYNMPHPVASSWVDRAPLESAVGVMLPLVAFDLTFLNQDDAFRSMREQYTPSYHNKIETYLLPLPIITLWGMRLGGLEGRSARHLEALSAQGISVGLTIAITQATKHITKRTRPDGSSKDYAFPSNHTATAFAFAALLDAEYGSDYPWVSALGYGLAGGVGLARIANNRHWATDVVTGAGVGIFSTYVGYLLNDLLWGRGLERFNWEFDRACENSPYTITLQKSYTTLLSSTAGYKASGLGNSLGVVARIPLYKQIGVQFASHLYTSDNNLSPKEYLHGYALMLGADYMHGFWEGRLWVDGSISMGYLSEVRLSEGLQSRSSSIPFIAPGPMLRIGVGGSLLTTPHFAVKLNGGFNYAPLSRPYSRATKKGLSGIDFGLGMTYVIE